MPSSKQRPSRISIPSFGFSSERRSTRAVKPSSRPTSIVAAAPLQQQDGELYVDPARKVPSLEALSEAEEPLFRDSYIAPTGDDRLPAPPSAALAAKWNEFLQGLSNPSSPADDRADKSTLDDSASESSTEDEEELPELYDDSIYCEVHVATPTVLKSPGKPKVVDISPAGSIRSSRPRSSSCDSASSHYTDGSLVSHSAPGTPLSSFYDSDHTGILSASAHAKAKLRVADATSELEQVKASYTRDDSASESDASSVAEEHAAPATAKAVRQTICRPASSEITRVWFRA